VGIEGALSESQEGQERAVASFSKTLSKAEKNYCVIRRQLLAIVKKEEHLHSQDFQLCTEHSALT
jgi:hypothetical protein